MKKLTIKESVKELKNARRHATEAGIKGFAYIGYKNDTLNNLRKYIDRIKESKSLKTKHEIHKTIECLTSAEDKTYKLKLKEIEQRKNYQMAIKVLQDSIKHILSKNENLIELVEDKEEFNKNMNDIDIKFFTEQIKCLEENRNKMVAFTQATEGDNEELTRRIMINIINKYNKELKVNKCNNEFMNNLEKCSINELKCHVEMIRKLVDMEAIQSLRNQIATKNKIGIERQEIIENLINKFVKMVLKNTEKNKNYKTPQKLKDIMEKYKNVNLHFYPNYQNDGREKYTIYKLKKAVNVFTEQNIKLLNYCNELKNFDSSKLFEK